MEAKKPNMIGRSQGRKKKRGSIKKLNSPDMSMDSQSIAFDQKSRAAYFQEEYKKVMERL